MIAEVQQKRSEAIILNAAQCKMARVATGLGLRDLAAIADVSPNTISRLERGEELRNSTIEALRNALEQAGVSFLDDDGNGAGVRFKAPA